MTNGQVVRGKRLGSVSALLQPGCRFGRIASLRNERGAVIGELIDFRVIERVAHESALGQPIEQSMLVKEIAQRSPDVGVARPEQCIDVVGVEETIAVQKPEDLQMARRQARELTARGPAMSRATLFVFALIGALSFLSERGIAQQPGGIHSSWPIENGVKHQPTREELRALGDKGLPSRDAQTVDQLYNELLGSQGGTHHTGNARMR